MNISFKIKGNIVDIYEENIFFGEVSVANGKVEGIEKIHSGEQKDAPYILPGFIDSHVHCIVGSK